MVSPVVRSVHQRSQDVRVYKVKTVEEAFLSMSTKHSAIPLQFSF
jgi:hypothetical protein